MPRKSGANPKFTEAEGAVDAQARNAAGSAPSRNTTIQFDFSPSARKRLEDLKQQTDAATRAEVVRNALRLYEWLVTQVDPNGVIVVEDKAGNGIFRIPVKAFLT